MPSSESTFPVIFLFSPGLVVCAIGVVLMLLRVRFLRVANRTWGELLSLEKRYPHGSFELRGTKATALPSYLLRVRFTAHGGCAYTFIENFGSRFLSYQQGSRVPVLYHPKHPQHRVVKMCHICHI